MEHSCWRLSCAMQCKPRAGRCLAERISVFAPRAQSALVARATTFAGAIEARRPLLRMGCSLTCG